MARSLAAFAACIVALITSGCQITRQISDTTLRYNLEAEKAQEQGLLLNIVRASQRRPLEFTGLISVTGQVLTTAGLTAALPIDQNGSPAPSPSVISPTAQVSAGPTYEVGVFDTQEFYQGILSPIKLQTIDYYMHADFPHSVLLDLVIDHIVVHQGARTLTIGNFPESLERYADFEGVIEDLLDQEINTEGIEEGFDVGPRLLPADLKDPRAIVPVSTPDLRLVTLPVSDLGDELTRAERDRFMREGITEVYQVQRIVPRYRFCFGISERIETLQGIPPSLRCAVTRPPQPSANAQVQSGPGCPEVPNDQGAQEANLLMAGPNLGRLLSAKWTEVRTTDGRVALPAFRPDCPVSYEFITRSTEAIIVYLGEVAAQELNPGGSPRYVTIPIGPADQPISTYQYRNARLLVVNNTSGSRANTLVSVDYLGQDYSIPADIQSGGASGFVLGFVNELLILNKSAKNLPTTNVLSLSGAH